MSIASYYISKGYTPMTKCVVLSGTDTAVIWSPASNKKVLLTDMVISKSASSGTAAFYFEGEKQFARFAIAGSTVITPRIGPIFSTLLAGKLFAKLSNSGTDDCCINLQGFEID
jgi:hypothetical protein